MSLAPITESFRRAKFGSAAAIAITSAMTMFPSAASAIELSEVSLQTDCRAAALDRIKTGAKLVIGWDLLCANQQVKLAKQAANAADDKDRASIQQAKEIDVVGECVDRLKQFRASDPEAFRALGKITRESACAAARRLDHTRTSKSARSLRR